MTYEIPGMRFHIGHPDDRRALDEWRKSLDAACAERRAAEDRWVGALKVLSDRDPGDETDHA